MGGHETGGLGAKLGACANVNVSVSVNALLA